MRCRALVAELMDDPALEERAHLRALAGLARLNALSGASGPVARAILRAAAGPVRLDILDVATGSGDVALGVARRLRRAGVEARVMVSDLSPRAVDSALARLRGAGIDAAAHRLDALQDDLPPADVVMCSLFLHHLPDGAVAEVLGRMWRAARRLLVVSDLARSRAGLLAAAVVPRMVTRSPIVHVDAVRSCRAALTRAELRTLAERGGVQGASIDPIFPWRLLLTARRGGMGGA